MDKNCFMGIMKLLLAAIICVSPVCAWADSEVHVETAGTLASLLPSSDKKLKVTGVINGTDIKYVRSLVTAGKVTSLDWSDVRIVAGGEAYYESFTTENDIIGEQMFYQCAKLQAMELPVTVTSIKKNAFANTGLKKIDIPNSVFSIGEDAFAYCSSLATVVIGKKVKTLSKGTFYNSNVTKAYVKPMTPPSTSSYLFSSSSLVLYVYKEALSDYKQSGWKEYYTSISGNLDRYYPQELDENGIVKELCGLFFEDAACTQLKTEYQTMSDDGIVESVKVKVESLMGETIDDETFNAQFSTFNTIVLKVKNNSWAEYEQEFRIHSYKAYSDANDWNEKLWVRCASYMGNPTGIYVQSGGEQLYVFVDEDVPSDATLYIAGSGVDQMFTSGKTGQKLVKGLNIIDGEADKLYYILYTANTKSMTKRLEEWPEMKIHIEGGKVDGYFDASRHTDTDYKKLLNAAANSTFVCKGKHSVMNIRTSILKETYPNKIAKAVACLDSLSVWEKDLSGLTEAVANGEKAGAPYYLTGGDAFYPGYFNNPTYADNDSPGSVAHATTYGIHISFDATKTFLNPYVSNYDENGTAHEFGHQMQYPIMLCGFTEGTNDLFSNYCRFHMGHRITSGYPLNVTMQEFTSHVPFNIRNVNNSCLRLFFSLYLYYHQAQKNTSFYPELFKALRADRMESMGNGAIDNNKSTLKFVRKVCEVAQEDLTDFFTVYGFFEPTTNLYVQDYGDHYVTTKQSDIDNTKAIIAQYPVKNRGIIFIEDRVESFPTTNFVTAAGKKRLGQDDWMWGDVGQFTSYLPGACEPSNYVYEKADSLYAMEGSGGLGFLMLDADGNIKYAANAKDVCIPMSVDHNFTIYSYDADGSLREIPKGGEGIEHVALSKAGQLSKNMSELTIKLILSGKIHGTDIKYMRKLITEKHLASIDLTEAQITTGGIAYYTNNGTSYSTSANTLGDYAFQGFRKLISMRLPSTITSIGSNAFSKSGLRMIDIPDKVTSVGEDAFAYCNNLTTVIIGENAKKLTLSKGAFYDSKVKDVYIKSLTPPNLSSYVFSSNPTIHVYASALADYQASGWAEYGTIVGDLDDYEDMLTTIESTEMDEEIVNSKSSNSKYYDLFGRKVTHLQPNSIYLRNGKKFIFK